jgi:tetratricopeptide (TPR) repeat protein
MKICTMLRKLLLIVPMVLVTSILFGQKAKVQSAWNYLKYDQLDKALEAIEAAAGHEQTMNMDKTWFYRGNIYHAMYNHAKYGSLSKEPLAEALRSYTKALELEPKGEFVEDIHNRLRVIGVEAFNRGARNYNDEKLKEAIASFDLSLKISTLQGVSEGDSLNLFAYLYTAYSAEKLSDDKLAKKYYQKLISLNYNDARIYSFLGNLYKSESDTAKALETFKQGRARFPNEAQLIIDELNIYLYSGKNKEAMDGLNLALQKDPDNFNLHFALGTVYDKLSDIPKAAGAYKKAIELKPDFFDAIYNLGAMYFNQGAELANAANNIPANKMKEYDEAKAKADAKFQESKPYLEKALELNAKDRNTLLSLKQLYARTGEKEKYQKISAELDKK